DRRMIQLLQDAGLGEDLGNGTVKTVSTQCLEDDTTAGVAIATEKRDAEAAGAEDAVRLVLRQWERGESLPVEFDRLLQLRHCCGPMATFQSGLVGIEVGFGAGGRLGRQAGDSLEVLPGGVEIAGDNLHLANRIEQRRQVVPLMLGQ